MKKKIVQTAGRDALGGFAPDFAHYNDDVLFGENWNGGGIDVKTRCLITVVSLLSQGICDSSLTHHMQNAKNNGVTKEEIAAAITHTAFYAGWPKGWAAFRLAKDVWSEKWDAASEKDAYQNGIMFPIGEKNDAYAKYFVGQSYLAPVSSEQVAIANVTFEPKCRNNWHVHTAEKGGGQILICVGGEGYYQEWGKPAVKLCEGDVVNIPVGVKHWHGAGTQKWFSHLAVEVPAQQGGTQWCEPVSEKDYERAVRENEQK